MPLPTDKSALLDRAQRLGELIDGFPERVPGALPALQEMLDGATDDEVLAASIDAASYASGHAAVVTLILDRGWETHRSSLVRAALAGALGTARQGSIQADGAADVLITLSVDGDDDVRDAACCALGALGVDRPEVRAALLARADDESDDARGEALAALARLGDARVVPVLRERFEQADPFEIYLLELDAAATIADPALLPGLLRIDAAWQADREAADEDDADLFAALDQAITLCRRPPA